MSQVRTKWHILSTINWINDDIINSFHKNHLTFSFIYYSFFIYQIGIYQIGRVFSAWGGNYNSNLEITCWCLVKLKKNPKIREKLGLTTSHPLTPLHIFFYFLETCTTKKKHTQFPKKRIRVRAWPTHPLPSFSRIFGFVLTWQNPLSKLTWLTKYIHYIYQENVHASHFRHTICTN